MCYRDTYHIAILLLVYLASGTRLGRLPMLTSPEISGDNEARTHRRPFFCCIDASVAVQRVFELRKASRPGEGGRNIGDLDALFLVFG